MRGINLAEHGHFVNILPPVDVTGGATADVFHLKRHSHATIAVQVGVSAAAFTKILLHACDNAAGDNPEAIPFSVYKEETSAGDTLGDREEVLAAGLTPSANDNILYVIELDAAELPEGKPYVELELTNGSNSVIASAVAVLSGARYTDVRTAEDTVLT